jgi:hypothetical protein
LDSEKSSRGGYRVGSGSKPKWHHGDTVVVRIPQALLNEVVWYAKLIDGQFINGMQLENCLACQVNYEDVTQSRELSDQVNSVTQERDLLDAEVNELHAINGQLLLEIEELQAQLGYVTQSSHSGGRGTNGTMAEVMVDLKSKIEQKTQGISHSFQIGDCIGSTAKATRSQLKEC